MAEDAAETGTEFELADATHVRVLETNLLHASDVIFWLDGSTSVNVNEMTRINSPLQITFTEKPKLTKFLHSAGKTAFWQTPAEPMFAGATTEAQRVRPPVANFDVAGEVVDLKRRYNPRLFTLTLGSGAGQGVVLYPSPSGVRPAAAGLVRGQVVVEAGQKPLSWALVTLVVTVAMGETISFRGQTDVNGDVAFALTGLPPLPLSTPNYAAVLRIEGDVTASANKFVNLADLADMELESATSAGTFAVEIPLTIRPGEIKRINSFNKSYIAVRTF